MKIIKDDRILEVTEKAYNVVYKDLGYKPYVEEIEEGNGDEGFKDINSYKKEEIIKILEEKEIEHNPNDKKEVLYNLMIEGE